MARTLLAIAVSLAVGFAIASWLGSPDPAVVPPENSEAAPTGQSFDPTASVDERILALEQAVNEERYARQVMQEELWFLSEELLRQSGSVPGDVAGDDTAQAAAEPQISRSEEYRRRNSTEGRIERLIEAGFLPSQASAIMRRESELQMEGIKARYEAERSGDPSEYWRNRDMASDALRTELGDADYERYLTANERSTSVTVSSVIDSSPAQSAGLQAGDEIVRYAGERVFSMTDLMQQTMDGAAGENVVVDIMRGGIAMQIVMPRGPVGISGGRRSR